MSKETGEEPLWVNDKNELTVRHHGLWYALIRAVNLLGASNVAGLLDSHCAEVEKNKR